MSDASRCALCKKEFGLMCWRHECGGCRRTMCDDCAPKSNGRRQCAPCARGGKPSSGAAGDSEAEREKRLRAAEERMKAAERRGRPQGGSSSGPTPSAPPAQAPLIETPSAPSDPPAPAPCATAPPVAVEPQEVPGAPTGNSVLDAAMRRRQQEQLGPAAARGNSSEKAQLLAEIINLLQRRGEEEPFGLRSMDETKLRMYLRYIREKGTAGRGE